MTATTESARESQTREHRLAAGLIELADMFAAGFIPEALDPDQALTIVHLAPTTDAITALAERMGLDIETHEANGKVRTSVDIPFGPGADGHFMAAYDSAVILHVSHITEAV